MSHCHTTLNTLRHLGFRITPQRELIIEALMHADQHMRADEIYDQVRKRTRVINLATVYRTLDLLIQQGLASRVNLMDGQAVYTSYTHGPHIHLVCRQCGGILDTAPDFFQNVTQQVQNEFGFQVDLNHVSLPGVCHACHQNAESEQ